jgi:hypothetical protein
VLVQRDQHGIFRDGRRDGARLFEDTRRDVAGAALGNFVDLEAAEAEPAAKILEALPVALGKLPLRTLL